MKIKPLKQFQVGMSPAEGIRRRIMLTHAPHCRFSYRYPEIPMTSVSLARIVRDAREHFKTCQAGKDVE